MKKRILALVLAVAVLTTLLTGCGSKEDEGKTIKIGAVTSLSGALQDYGEQFQKGFEIGLDYATNGTNQVAGYDLEVIWEDTATSPDTAKDRTMKLLDVDKVDIITGYASSGDAAACLPLAEEYETIFVIEPAAADTITGPLWNENIFRTGRNTAMDAEAVATVMMDKFPNGTVACLAPDNTFGTSGVAPVKAAVEKRGGTVILEEYAPQDATDFTPYILRIKEAKPDYLFVVWAAANPPWPQIGEAKLIEAGIEIATNLPEFATLKGMFPVVGSHGFSTYHYNLPDNDINDYLVEKHNELHGENPDIFTPGGMSAAIAIVTALEKTNGDTTDDVLRETLKGMHFDSPTGDRFFRAEDGQAMQVIYEAILGGGTDYPVPQLVREIPWEDVACAVTNGK